MTGANVPRVSLQRTFTILLLLYCVALVAALLAGGALLAHVDPYGECLLYSHLGPGEKLYYGSEYICDGIGGFFVLTMFGAVIMFYLTFKHRRELISFYKSGEFTKGDAALTISNSTIASHAAITFVVIILTIATTVGYQNACSNIESKLSGKLRNKINKDPNLTRGERIDERFTDDNEFWRYTGKIGNPYGDPLYEVRITCRTIFTDPNVHQELHDNHVALFSSYFGYWYKQDLFAYNSQVQSVLTNSLIEATLAGAWLSTFVWLGALAFMIIQKYYIKREKWAGDKVSLHSGMDGSFRGSVRKYEGSMFSGSGYHSGMAPGNMSSMSRPGTGAGGTLQRGQGMRGSIDDLALMVAGAPPAQGALLANQQQNYHQPGYPQQLSQFQPQQPQFQQQQHFQQQQQFQQQQFQPQQQQFQPQQFQQQQSYADQSEETEIM